MVAITLSQQLLYAVKTGNSHAQLTQQLQQLTVATLQKELTTDEAKKAFWLNIYNAYVQAALLLNPQQYSKRHLFYRKKFIEIAGQCISPDTIEHGILRRSRHKWSLGYFCKLFPSAFEKMCWVTVIDYRIHFALNCGATSCPPIAFYNAASINEQLHLATASYLGTEVTYTPAENKVQLPALMSWFRADFGGKKGIKNILLQHHIVAPSAAKTLCISFKKYNWQLTLNTYKNL
jgi:Protein of unknown function, DUF547